MICITSGGGSGLPCDSGSQIHHKHTNNFYKSNTLWKKKSAKVDQRRTRKDKAMSFHRLKNITA